MTCHGPGLRSKAIAERAAEHIRIDGKILLRQVEGAG